MKLFKLFVPVVIAIFLIIFDYKFSYLNDLRQSVVKLMSQPIYFVVNSPKEIYTWINEQGASEYQLNNSNTKLRTELLTLKVQLQKQQALMLENKKLKTLLNSSYVVEKQKFVLARISSISQSRLKKQIVINKGSNDHLKVGQAVLGSLGVVGQISYLTPLYASVLIITDPTQYVPIKNARSGVKGISRGIVRNKHVLNVDFIAPDADVRVGDVFLSSALGGKFPDGYPLGRVVYVKRHKHKDFLDVQLMPIQTVKDLEFVIVITD